VSPQILPTCSHYSCLAAQVIFLAPTPITRRLQDV
jgi:hypothetical protein